jgi:hypothetical protein
MKRFLVRQARWLDQANSAAAPINIARENESSMVHPQERIELNKAGKDPRADARS